MPNENLERTPSELTNEREQGRETRLRTAHMPDGMYAELYCDKAAIGGNLYS